jgi:inhibitor of cysteine peptidase
MATPRGGRPGSNLRGRRPAPLAAFALAALAACAPLGPRDVDAGPADSVVKLARGDALVVRLDANPTTGYAWTTLEAAPGVLAADGEPVYAPAPTAANTVGAGGVVTYRFRAVAAGRGVVAFAYRRAADTRGPPARMVRWIVVVE